MRHNNKSLPHIPSCLARWPSPVARHNRFASSSSCSNFPLGFHTPQRPDSRDEREVVLFHTEINRATFTNSIISQLDVVVVLESIFIVIGW